MTPWAAFHLGLLLERKGDSRGAGLAFEQVIVLRHPEAAPLAAFHAGALTRDPSLLLQAIDLAEPSTAPLLAFGSGLVLSHQGNVEGARIAFQHALDSNHLKAVHASALYLSRLLMGDGDGKGAFDTLRYAVDSDALMLASEEELIPALRHLLLREADGLGACTLLHHATDITFVTLLEEQADAATQRLKRLLQTLQHMLRERGVAPPPSSLPERLKQPVLTFH